MGAEKGDDFKIDKSNATCSIFISVPEGTLMIRFLPFFNEEGICRNYDVWNTIYDHNGNTNIHNQYFAKREDLLKVKNS